MCLQEEEERELEEAQARRMTELRVKEELGFLLDSARRKRAEEEDQANRRDWQGIVVTPV